LSNCLPLAVEFVSFPFDQLQKVSKMKVAELSRHWSGNFVTSGVKMYE
jgi:hypothetical protein